MIKKQVNSEVYDFSNYCNIGRWNSYWHQLDEVSGLKKGSEILLIGAGDGIVPMILRKMNYNVTVFDFDEDLLPDIVGDVKYITDTIRNSAYDAIICCQVLEHIPGEYFDSIMQQFSTLLHKDGRLILSLPQSFAPFCCLINIPKVHILINKTIPLFRNKIFEFDGEHYWQVDTKGYRKKDMIKRISKNFCIIRTYTIFELQYHWFIIAEPIKNKRKELEK